MDSRWFPPEITLTLTLGEVLDMTDALESVVDELERMGEHHLGFAVHQQAQFLLDKIIPPGR